MSNAAYLASRIKYSLLIVFLLVLNLLVVAFYDLELSRGVRLLSIAVLFIYYILKKGIKNKWITLSLLIFLVKDICFQVYEMSWGYKLYLLLGALAYITLVAERIPKLRNTKLSSSLIVITLLLILANSYTLHMLMETLSYQFKDLLEISLFYFYGAMMIILGVTAIVYNNKYNSNRSLLYTFLAFSFIFSDIAALFAYYFGFEMFYFFDRFFFIIAMGLFVNYGLNYKSAQEEYYQYELIDKNL